MSKALNNKTKLNSIVSVTDYGAKGDGVTDDTAAIQAAIDAVHATGGGTVRTGGKHRIAGNLTVKDYVSLVGNLELPDELLPGSGASYDSQNFSLIIASTATVTVQDSASVSNMLVLREGLNAPFANAAVAATGLQAFAGKAFTIGGPGAYFHHLLILGFEWAIYSSGYERVKCEYVLGDCTNGLHLEDVRDVAYVENCHFWPWLTVHQSWSFDTVAPNYTFAGSLLQRGGVGYKYINVADWCKFTNCFAYGYATGFEVTDCNSVSLVGCGVDNYSAISGNTTVGFKIVGTTTSQGIGIALVRCQAASQGTGVSVDCADPLATVTMTACEFWVNDDKHVAVTNGRAIITSSGFRSNAGTPSAIGVFLDTPAGATVTSCVFAAVPTPFSVTGSALTRLNASNNRFVTTAEASVAETAVYDLQPLRSDKYTYSQSSNLGFTDRIYFNRGTNASPADSQSGDQAYRRDVFIRAGGATGNIGRERFIVSAAPTNTSMPGRYIISTTPPGATTPIDRLIVNDNGNVYCAADNSQSLGVSTFRWLDVYAVNFRPGAGTVIWTSGAGSPEGVVNALVGSLYTRTDGGAATTLYVKESGTGNTGWVAK